MSVETFFNKRKKRYESYVEKFCLILLAGFALTACQPPQSVLLASGEYAESDNWNGQWRVINIWAEWVQAMLARDPRTESILFAARSD